MMKKLRNHSGFSLVEMLAAIAVLVLLIVGMDAGINAGIRAYSDAIFESNSAALAGILNSAVGDILRYSDDIEINPALDPRNHNVSGFKDSQGHDLPPEKVPFVFSNFEYNIRGGYFYVQEYRDGTNHGVLQLKNLSTRDVREVVNTGAYPDLEIADFKISYVAPDPHTPEPENYFNVEYKILDLKKEGRSRDVKYTVRLLNPEG